MEDKGIDGRILGKIIRRFRKEKQTKDKKWTISYLADEADLDDKYLQKLEKGKKKYPQFITIGKIARALNVSTEVILDEYFQEIKKVFPDDKTE